MMVQLSRGPTWSFLDTFPSWRLLENTHRVLWNKLEHYFRHWFCLLLENPSKQSPQTFEKARVEFSLHAAIFACFQSPTVHRNSQNSYMGGLCGWYLMRAQDNHGRDPFNQNFRKFRSKTQWIGSVHPEKFRKNWSTFWGGPLFPVGPVGILVEWIASPVF